LTAHDDAHAHDERSTIHALAHAHASAHADDLANVTPLGDSGFPHEKLDAYRIALHMASIAKRVAADIPRGHRSIADHLLRATSNAVLLLAEGANRRGPKEKRQRFVESRGECAEAAAACDLIMVLDLAPQAELVELKKLAGRVSAMLTRLIQRLS
jgi:four helix bundle protein